MSILAAVSIAVADGSPISPPKQLNDDIELPVLRTKREPNYPGWLLKLGVEGRVRLQAVVRDDGMVGDIVVEYSDHPLLSSAAIEAVRGWRYTPAKEHGRPVEVHYTLVVKFSLGSMSRRISDDACFGPGVAESWGPIDAPPRVQAQVPVAVPPNLEDVGGQARIEFEVCRDGRVREVQILEATHPDLGATAAMSARRWKFVPAQRGGVPVAAKHTAELTIRPVKKK